MEAREQVNVWLQSLGGNFQLDGQGLFASKDADGQEFVVEVPENAEQVYFCAPIANVPDDHKVECLEQLLRWNLYGTRTRYCVLGLEENTNRIIMHYVVEVGRLDEQSFSNVFNNFIAHVKKIKNAWEDFVRELGLGGDSNAAMEEFMPMRI